GQTQREDLSRAFRSLPQATTRRSLVGIMRGGQKKRAIETIRQKGIDQTYTISNHAKEEMSDDNLTAADVEQVLLTGRIRKRFTRDPRGERCQLLHLNASAL